MKRAYLASTFILLMLLTAIPLLQPQTRADTIDYDVPGGHFYTQAVAPGTPAGTGYAVLDAGVDERGQQIRFWSEFRRLGGVQALGYPASHRFMLDGFVTQATQRVLMQWRPEVQQVYFVNVFDKLHDLGKDTELFVKYQVPPQIDVNDVGKPFSQVVAERQAYLDASQPIKQRYFSVSDPLQLNGLPTSRVTDASGVFDIIRLQRVVIQYWKKSVPGIANAGDVTVGLGGDFSKEFGLVPAQASQPLSVQAATQFITPVPQFTPTPVPPTPTPAPRFAFGQEGPTRGVNNCALTEVRGIIRDENGNPLANLTVRVGVQNGDYSTVSFPTGGNGEYNVFLDNKVKAGSWYVFVIGVNNTQLSPVILFNTSGSCNPGDFNTVYVDFRRGAP